MKRNLFFQLLSRLRVGRKLLLIYLLDLTAVVFISSILIQEKYIAIDFSDKEIIGNMYVQSMRETLADLALVGAGATQAPGTLGRDAEQLAVAERDYGKDMESSALNGRLRAALGVLNAQAEPSQAQVDAAFHACRELITRVGNQSNLILDPDLDSYYAMSLVILRYPALLESINAIGGQLRDTPTTAAQAAEMRTQYLVLEGQLDGVLQGLKSDFSEATAANHGLAPRLTPAVDRMLVSVASYRDAARLVIDSGVSVAPYMLHHAALSQQGVVATVHQAWLGTGDELGELLKLRVHALFKRMWFHLGTALFLLCGLLVMVYSVAQQISRPLRQLAGVMDTVRRTGDYTLRAVWHSQDEIGQLVKGFNEMLRQLDHERDVQKELAANARASAAQYALVEATPVPMMVTAVPGHEILHVNKPALSWLAKCATNPWASGLNSAVRGRFFQQLADREAVDQFEVHWRASAEPRWAMLSARRLVFQGQDAVLTAFTPINQLKLMEQRLELWAKVFEASSESILILSQDFTLLTANEAFYRATGYSSEDLVGGQTDFLLLNDGELNDLEHALGRANSWQGEAQVRRASRGEYPAWLIVSTVRHKHGDVSHYICTIIDVTERKRNEARIQFLAEHDVLTELPNRALFSKRLAAELKHADSKGLCTAVLFIDLDRFKNINDSLGHHVGDGLLRSVSRRLLSGLRPGDTVSRLGGDEFTVILSGIPDAETARHIIETRILPSLSHPHIVGESSLEISCSVGVAMYPSDGQDISALMQNADAAMYQAKAAGRNLVKFFSLEIAERLRLRLSLESALRLAIEHQQLSLVYQPCIDVRTGALASVEGLLRWHHPDLGHVGPAQFIPIAEDTGLIIGIGAWVIERACQQMAKWRDEDGLSVNISINLSAIQLRDHDIVRILRESLSRHRVPASSLELEVTKTVLMENAKSYLPVINGLRTLGVKMSLDDFGTGYSSLSDLNRFPLDRIKIDRAFVHDMLDDPVDLTVVKSIVELGHELGLKVVAEGVETEHEANILRSIGCDEFQGFLFSRPLTPDQLKEWAIDRVVV